MKLKGALKKLSSSDTLPLCQWVSGLCQEYCCLFLELLGKLQVCLTPFCFGLILADKKYSFIH